MIDVRVTQHDGLDGVQVEGQSPVPLKSLIPPALKQTAVEQDPVAGTPLEPGRTCRLWLDRVALPPPPPPQLP